MKRYKIHWHENCHMKCYKNALSQEQPRTVRRCPTSPCGRKRPLARTCSYSIQKNSVNFRVNIRQRLETAVRVLGEPGDSVAVVHPVSVCGVKREFGCKVRGVNAHGCVQSKSAPLPLRGACISESPAVWDMLHVTRHTSHVTRHTSHVTCYLSLIHI